MSTPSGNLGQLVVTLVMDPSQYNASAKAIPQATQQMASGVTAGANQASAAIDKVGHSTTAARREMIVLAHEAATGSWKNFGGSAMVLAEQYDLIHLAMTPIGATAVAAAAAVGSFVAAIVIGAHEASQFNNSIKLTGNYAGQTASSIYTMSQQLSEMTHSSVGSSRTALQELIATGQIAGPAIGALGEAMLNMHKLSGESLEDIAKDYAKMPEGVAKWAEEHNRSMHFITTAQYEQIRALEEAGKVQDAVLLTARALDDHLKSESVPNLGYLERAWRGLGSAISSAWESMKSVGRGESAAEKVAAAQKDLAELDELQRRSRTQGVAPPRQDAYDGARKRLADAQAQLAKEQADADKKAKDADTQKNGIAASDYLKRLRDEEKGVSRINQALDEYHQKIAAYNAANPASQVSAAQQKKDEDAIRKKYTDTSGQGEVNRVRKNLLEAAIQDTKNSLELIGAAYTAADNQLQAQHKATLISDQTFYTSEITLSQDATNKKIVAYQREKQVLQSAYWKAPADERIKITKEIGEVDTQITKLRQDNASKDVVYATQQAEAQRKYLKSIADTRNALLAQSGVSAPKAMQDFDDSNRGNVLQAASTGDFEGAQFLAQDRQLTLLNAKYADIVSQAKEAQDKIALNQREGLTGFFSGFSQLRETAADSVSSLKGLYEEVNRASWGTTDQGVLRNLDQLRDKIRSSMLDSQNYFQDFADAGKSAFSGMFSSIVAGTSKPSDAVRSMISNMLSSFAQLFANKAYSSLTNSLFGAIFGGSTSVASAGSYGFTMPTAINGSGALFGVGAGMFATGGSVNGPGTGTSDSIPARLSNGEFVVNARAVAQPGVRSLLESINGGGGASGRNRFATGGSVTGSSSASSASPNVEVHIHGAPAGTQVQQSQGANGAPRIDVLLQQVDRHIAAGIRTGSGATARTMQAQYGLNRATGRG
ncbi:phage tail length tape measure family protein [Burkholderia gladioli]|uniref:phage tail length tape measure family protein n=1 Tax=Burkholderia gladioli TaxID=28095 RepID=UPI00163F3B7F|nr:phage tail length tape measure family protein [Burkholderia gladioli]